MTAPTTAFRVEHVGSFVRPERLLDAARANKAGKLDDAQFKTIQDGCIRDIVAFQESIGLPTITDGELRRRSWSAALPCNCDVHAREDVAARGEDADELTERYAALFNGCIRDKPASMAVGIHLCRGNLKGAWMAEGGYEPVADARFNRLNATTYCLERRIDAAAKHVPLEQLGIGPQCGFSSGGGGGQTVTQDDTRRKLELIMQTANEVWGTT